ncbi:MAG: hypothetical protein OEY36_03790 [Gammaproteobacteria bacterium]|nr:hypothetical protein [Gammaproteobacteria bacterium]
MKNLLLIPSIALALAACGPSGGSGGSGGSGSTINSLKMPSKMSVVSASDEPELGSRINALKLNYPALRAALTDPDTDYSTDTTNTYVYDPSMESLETVNMILCLLEQTRATDKVNSGPYVALVNEDKCEQGKNQSNAGNAQGGSAQATEFNTWTIESTRASNSSPQLVQIWVPGEELQAGADPGQAMDAQTILVEVSITEGISDSNPFGSFEMNFKGVIDAGLIGGTAGTIIETMKGNLQTVANSLNKPQFKFVNLGGGAANASITDFSFTEASNVILDDATGSSGSALTRRSESYNNQGTTYTQSADYAIAFNNTHLLRGKDENDDSVIDSQSCRSRDNFDTQVWQYNLYHAVDGSFNGNTITAGQRVEMNSGFPIRFDSNNDGTDDRYGWVGYHGVWADGQDLADGTQVTRHDYASNSSESMTVNVSNGKLVRRTASQTQLTNFQGDEFYYWGQHPTLSVEGQWVVTVDTNNNFQITSTISWGEGSGPVISSTIDHDSNPATAEVTVAASISLTDYQSVWLWSDALGGNVVYTHDSAIAAVNRNVTYYAEDFISPDDSLIASSGLTLYCYDRCLKGGLTQANVDAASSSNDLYYQYNYASPSPFVYTLSSNGSKLILTDNANSSEVSAVGLDMSALGHQWGINTGEMVTTPITAANPWEVYNSAVSFRWESGENNWNRLVTVSNSAGTLAVFDRPLHLSYVHSTANDANANSHHDGDTFLLQYQGAGNLHGFPWIENIETGRWYSAVTLIGGTQLSDANNSFVVKPIEQEQSMREDNAGCGTLAVDTLFNDSNLALPVVSDIGTISFNLTDKPLVTDAPAVIEGVLQ